MLVRAGEVEDWFNFIGRGLIHQILPERKGRDQYPDIFEGHIIHSQESFHSRTLQNIQWKPLSLVLWHLVRYDDMERF